MAARKKTRRKSTKRGAAARKRTRARKTPAKRGKPATARAKPWPKKRPAARGPSDRTAGARNPARPATTGGEAPPAAPARTAQSLAILASEPVRVGVVTHWFARARVAALALEAPLAAGERLHVRGATSDFLATAASLRVRGRLATLSLPERARPGDTVFALRAPA